MVVVTLDCAAWNTNTSPLNEFPANACPAHVLTPHVLGSVAFKVIFQEHATGVQAAFIKLGIFATQIEPGGTGTVWPELLTVVAGH